MEYLMQARDLDEQLVPGYRTLNVIGLTPGRRCLLYHRLFSSQAPDFVSEPAEVQQALQTVSQTLSRLKEHKRVSWLLDSGFDGVAVWRTILGQAAPLAVGPPHPDPPGAFPNPQGERPPGGTPHATTQPRPPAPLHTTLA